MSALMTDLLNGSVTPGIGNATCNAGGKLLKMVELNQKYGQAQVENGLKNMQLVTSDDQPTAASRRKKQADADAGEAKVEA